MDEETSDLHLGDGDHPRRILKLDDEWIAWGGETGAISWNGKEIRHWDEDGEDFLCAVAVHGRQVALGLASGEVSVHRYEHSAKEFLTRKAPDMLEGPLQAASVRDMKFFDENTLVIASEDGLVVWNIQSNEQWLVNEVKKQHDGSGIRSLAIRDSLMVSVAMDGRWCLWDLNKRSLVHRGDVCITRKDAGEVLGADAWDRSCRPLFMSKTSLLLPGAAWPQFRLLSPNVTNFDSTEVQGHIEAIVAAASRKNFVITIGRDKRVVLWSVNKVCCDQTICLNVEPNSSFHAQKLEPKLIRILKELECAATDIVWETNGKLRLPCANGTMVVLPSVDLPTETVEDPPPKQQTIDSPPSTDETTAVPPQTETTTTTEETPQSSLKTKRTVTFADKDTDATPAIDEIKTTAEPVAALESSTKPNVADESDDDDIFDKSSSTLNRFIDDEADDDDDDGVGGNNENLSSQLGQEETADLNERDDFDNGHDIDNDSYGVDPDDLPLDHDLGRSMHPVQSLPEPQPPFAPSASPLELDRHFLCWNHIGSTIARQDDDRSSVDITFTDAGFRRPITIKNSLGFILGSLGEDGGIFCTDMNDEDEDDDDFDEDNAIVNKFSASTREAVKRSKKIVDPNKPTGSTVYFHRYESAFNVRDKDWRLVLPTGERALGCATGAGWAAVMTK